MKFKFLLLTIFYVVAFKPSIAQTNLKIGHVNIQEIVQKHPGADSIRKVLDKEANEMEKIYGEMLAEHNAKLKLYESEQQGYSDFVRKTKEDELLDMAQKIQEYNQTAQQQLQKRNVELLRPVYEQINSEIKNIADSNNFTYILDLSNGTIAYVSSNSQDITPLVLEKIKK